MQIHPDAQIFLNQWDDLHVKVRNHVDNLTQRAWQASRLRAQAFRRHLQQTLQRLRHLDGRRHDPSGKSHTFNYFLDCYRWYFAGLSLILRKSREFKIETQQQLFYPIQGLALGCVNSPPRTEGARRRDPRNLGPTF